MREHPFIALVAVIAGAWILGQFGIFTILPAVLGGMGEAMDRRDRDGPGLIGLIVVVCVIALAVAFWADMAQGGWW